MSMIIVEHRIHKILLSRGRTEGPVAMNAFELISTSQGLNLSNLFEKQMGIVKREMRFTSKCSANEIIAKIEQAAGPLGFDVKKNNCKALSQNPELHTATMESIHSIISFLISKGIHQKDLPRIFGMCPKILTSNIKTDLNPVFYFLLQDLQVQDHNFRKVVKKNPRLLTSSVINQLKPALFYLKKLGFKDLAALAYQDSILLVSNVEGTLIPKLMYLESLGFSKDEARFMVLRCPSLFTFSIENNFQPKFEYFDEEMGGKLEELKEFPQYFAFSLENRIKPRYLEVVESGIHLPLSVMLKSTDEDFRELIKKGGG
ncbi:hypothetical protein TanjilG_16622 [Lupinus angustifolius]|uniref:NAF domain-containing protein n=1 Tax=Lupinus angustifolius TaxID=3871 RepID=A0A4P1QZB5_LUPAN|nr:hypothetical protein TanjilG_16622 [Lupinus angustifolius]